MAADEGLLSRERLTEIVADAYRGAALAGAEMRQATEALESIRSRYDKELSAFDAWLAADEQIGLADEPTLNPILWKLREQLAEEVRRSALDRLASASAGDRWPLWLQLYAQAFDAWRPEICEALAEADVAFEDDTAPTPDHLRTMTRYILRDRWSEVSDFLIWLTEQEALEPVLRARIRATAGEILLYHFVESEEAMGHFQWACGLASDDDAVVAGMGEYWLQQGDIERSRSLCQKSISLAPSTSRGYVLMGDSYEREGDVDAAEEWYREAINHKPGDSEGYTRVIRLLGRPELLQSRENELKPLFERAVAVAPSGEYSAAVEVGDAYRRSERYEEAHEWYDRAIALDAMRLYGLTTKGYAYLDVGDYAQAQAAFREGVMVAPEAFEGYWGLAITADTEQQDKEALRWYQESLERRPQWGGIIRARIGELYMRGGQFPEAETELLNALRLAPTDQSVVASLHELADQSLQAEAPLSLDDARRILTQTREIVGEEYEATLQNRLGNLSYYDGDFATASQAYERAIALDEDPVFYANLAGSLALSQEPGRRVEELERAAEALVRARELDPGNQDYVTQLAALRAEQTVVRFGDEVALQLPWVLPLLRVEVSAEMRPLVLDEAGEELSPVLLQMIEEMRVELASTSGLAIPGVLFRDLGDSAVTGTAYRVRIRETAFPLEALPVGSRFCPAPLEPLVEARIPANLGAHAIPGAWVEGEHWPAAEEAGITLQTPLEYLLEDLKSVLRANLDQFVDHQQVTDLLQGSEAGESIIGSAELLTWFVTVIRALVRERVPVTEIQAIAREFESLASDGLDSVSMVEAIRALPEVARSLPGVDGDANRFRLAADLEDTLSAGVVEAERQPVVTLTALQDRDVRDAIRARARDVSQPVVIATTARLRPFVWALMEQEIADVSSILADELDPEAVRQAAQIEVAWSR